MSREIQIVIPEYIQEMPLSKNGRRKIYYEKSDDKIPKKYQSDNFIWKKGKLFDKTTKKFVVKNSAWADVPRTRAIAGNDVWARVHPRIRMAMVDAIKNDFRRHLPKELNLNFPIQIEMTVFCPPRYCDWDVGNLWVYDKVFEDLLVDEGLIPDDSIQYVTKASGPRYIPIVNQSARKMVFTLREEDNPAVLSHVMYDLHRKKTPILHEAQPSAILKEPLHVLYHVVLSSEGEPGSILTNEDDRIIFISIGKKINWSKVRKGFTRAFSTLVQLNGEVVISREIWDNFRDFVVQEFIDRGLQVHVYASRDKVQSGT